MRKDLEESPHDTVEDWRQKTLERARIAKLTVTEVVERAELFRTFADDAYATVDIGDHKETFPIESRAFKDWLQYAWQCETGTMPKGKALADAIRHAVGYARYSGDADTIRVDTRVAFFDGAIYLDLCNWLWEVIEITRDGWKIFDGQPLGRPPRRYPDLLPVKFRRTSGMLDLPHPVLGGSLDALREFVNVTDQSFTLLQSWLVAALRPTGPYPIGLLTNESGSCKSTLMRVCRKLIDPNTMELGGIPKNNEALILDAARP
jgi:hypothetical protein